MECKIDLLQKPAAGAARIWILYRSPPFTGKPMSTIQTCERFALRPSQRFKPVRASRSDLVNVSTCKHFALRPSQRFNL